MPIQFEKQENTTIPLEVENVRPDLLREASLDDIRRTKIFHGKEEVEFGEFFSVAESGGDPVHHWQGDCSGVHWIGKGLREGRIEIDGNCGRHLGSEMTGGEILVRGNASDWVGGEMKGGRIRVNGDAGHLVGAAYRGSPKGMAGGEILIEGKAGNEVGHTMRRGLIAVGSLGDLAGFNMLAGSILVFGESGIRPGPGMRRGTIAFLGDHRPDPLPTFRFACRQKLNVLTLISRYLNSEGYEKVWPQQIDLFHGDLLNGGRGEILFAADQ